jgi:hypothetical protein
MPKATMAIGRNWNLTQLLNLQLSIFQQFETFNIQFSNNFKPQISNFKPSGSFGPGCPLQVLALPAISPALRAFRFHPCCGAPPIEYRIVEYRTPNVEGSDGYRKELETLRNF